MRFIGVVAIAIGMALVALRRELGGRILDDQRNRWPFRGNDQRSRLRITEWDERITPIIVAIVGVGFVAWGILVLLGMLRFSSE